MTLLLLKVPLHKPALLQQHKVMPQLQSLLHQHTILLSMTLFDVIIFHPQQTLILIPMILMIQILWLHPFQLQQRLPLKWDPLNLDQEQVLLVE